MNKHEYKEAVNKIVISDELRKKIIHHSSEKKPYKRNHINQYFRRTVRIAACFALCMLSYYALTNHYHTSVHIPTNTTSPVQSPDSANNSDTNEYTIASVTPAVDDVQNHTNPSDEPHLPTHTSQTAAAVPSSAHRTTNNSVKTEQSGDEAHSLPTSGTSQGAQSNSLGTEPMEQSNFPPALSTSPSVGSPPTEVMVGNGNPGGGCGVYLGEDMSAIAEIEQELGYEIKVPHYIPDGYKTDSLSAPFGEFAEITYTNETDTLYYRTAKDSEDISGDYNDYSEIETVVINDNDVTIKGNNHQYHNASWFADDEAFSIYSDNGIEKDTMIDIVKNVD